MVCFFVFLSLYFSLCFIFCSIPSPAFALLPRPPSNFRKLSARSCLLPCFSPPRVCFVLLALIPTKQLLMTCLCAVNVNSLFLFWLPLWAPRSFLTLSPYFLPFVIFLLSSFLLTTNLFIVSAYYQFLLTPVNMSNIPFSHKVGLWNPMQAVWKQPFSSSALLSSLSFRASLILSPMARSSICSEGYSGAGALMWMVTSSSSDSSDTDDSDF